METSSYRGESRNLQRKEIAKNSVSLQGSVTEKVFLKKNLRMFCSRMSRVSTRIAPSSKQVGVLNPIHHSIFFLPLVTAGGGHHPPYDKNNEFLYF